MDGPLDLSIDSSSLETKLRCRWSSDPSETSALRTSQDLDTQKHLGLVENLRFAVENESSMEFFAVYDHLI